MSGAGAARTLECVVEAGRDLLARFRPVFSVAARAGRRSTDPRANEPIVFSGVGTAK
jgi:hypothetical protein